MCTLQCCDTNSISCYPQKYVISYLLTTKVNLYVYDIGDCRYDNDLEFHKFKQQLYHTSISAVLQPLQAGMTRPVVQQCPDGHYQWVIYDLVAFIADYPEQVMLTEIVQGWCPK
jgi:Plavaka transposase